jgi:hypothetical protein
VKLRDFLIFVKIVHMNKICACKGNACVCAHGKSADTIVTVVAVGIGFLFLKALLA